MATDPDCAYVPDMGRPHRVQIAGGTYHVTSRGNRHQSIYHDYARYFNERHSFEGHLFERRFSSRLVETEEHLAKALLYIAFNPVEAGLCVHPRDWRWSSFYGVEESFVFDLQLRPADVSGARHRTRLA